MSRLLCVAALAVTASVASAQANSTPAAYYGASFSPDGKRVLFESTRDGKYAIYIVNLDGSRLIKLTSDAADNENASWSHDGRQIVFSSNRDGHLKIYTMNADGSAQTRVTTTAAANFYGASFSPNGKHIAFQGDPGNGAADSRVFVVDTDGSGFHPLTDSTMNSRSAGWAAGGDWITFNQQPSAGMIWNEITPAARAKADAAMKFMAIRPDGSGLREWPTGGLRFRVAKWSRDGKTLYVVSPPQGERAIYAMNADGSNVRRVADGARVPSPGISPDGRSFVFTRNDAGKAGVFVSDIATGVERRVVGRANN